jgi:hypothetical protein
MTVSNSHWQRHVQEHCKRRKNIISQSPTQSGVARPTSAAQHISEWSQLLFRILEIRDSTPETGSHRCFIMYTFNVLYGCETWSPTLMQEQKQFMA